ncbi:hypothetical protein C9374_010528 [Naegleria lovaniensis]|uniref:Uncharacterized protein n=1 Tax=Naegleria lovaniensis TaxID=51637 RepID=A0AA88GGD4_NAELO|nr:uncharacterized protein C9374_010528 [Naegleria lovaniensis]KAG2374784.1 hypothetical protein C9374_010528 [Naegleria lovaniensis]
MKAFLKCANDRDLQHHCIWRSELSFQACCYTGMAIVSSTHECFIGSDSSIVVLNLENGQVIQTILLDDVIGSIHQVEWIDSETMIVLHTAASIFKKQGPMSWIKHYELKHLDHGNKNMVANNTILYDAESRMILSACHLGRAVSMFNSDDGQLLKTIKTSSIVTKGTTFPHGMCVNYLTGELLLCLNDRVVFLK